MQDCADSLNRTAGFFDGHDMGMRGETHNRVDADFAGGSARDIVKHNGQADVGDG